MPKRALPSNDSALVPAFDSALRYVTFEQALQVQPLLEAAAEVAQRDVDKAIAARAGDAAGVVVNSFRYVAAKGEVIVKFTEKAGKLHKSGTLKLVKDGSNRFLAKLQNAKNGKFVETARLTGGAAKAMRLGAAIGSAVLSAAHLVSSADLAKKLGRVEGKLDFLVAARRISQLSRLEAVYRQARELVCLPASEAARWELHRLGQELFQLRAEWRRELIHRLDTVENLPESRNWFVAFFQGFKRDAHSRENAKQITQSEVEIGLLDVSMALHLAVAQSAGTLDPFLKVSLPDELIAIERTKELLASKRSTIQDRQADSQAAVTATLAGFDATLDRFRALALPDDKLKSHFLSARISETIVQPEQGDKPNQPENSLGEPTKVHVTCPACSQVSRVPAQLGRLRVVCPGCQHYFGVDV